MGDYLKGEKLSTTYPQIIGIGGAADRAGIHATTQKEVWTDDGDGGNNLFPFTAARDALQMTGTRKIEFNDDAVYINSGTDSQLNLVADGEVDITGGSFDFNSSGAIAIDGSALTIGGDASGAATLGAIAATATSANITLTTSSSGNIMLTPAGYIQVASGKKLQFADSGEYVSGNGTDLTLASGAAISLTATSDVNIPVNVGLRFGDGGENIETDNTDFTITSGGKINLTATTDAIIPVNVGLIFGDGAEKIESDNTNLTINSGADINLTCATGDVKIPANIGLTFGDDGEKIEGDGTDLSISSSGNLNLTSTVNEASAIYLRANAGTSETVKVHSDQGTGASAATESDASIQLISDAGGIGILSGLNAVNAIRLEANGGTSENIIIHSNQGTSATEGAASIQLLSDAGGINIKSELNNANAILLTADGGTSETIKIHSDQGTGAGSIELTSDAGGIDINCSASGKIFAVDAGSISLDSTSTSNVTMTANTGSTQTLTLSATNANGSYAGNILIDSDGVVEIRANDETNSYAGAGIQIGTDRADVDISIGHTTSNIRVGDNFYVAGDGEVAGDFTVTGTLNTSATAYTAIAISHTAPTLTLTNTTHEYGDLDDTSAGGGDARETRLIFQGETNTGTVHQLGTILCGHDGSGTDKKGQMQFFVNDGTDSDDALTNVMNITSGKRVGIGTAAPSALFHVNGLSNLDGGVICNISKGANDFAVYGDAEDNVLFVDGSADKVGIKTNSPGANLHIHQENSDVNYVKFTNTDAATNGFYVGIDSYEVAALVQYEDNDMDFYTNNVRRMRLENDGMLGIGNGANTPVSDVEIWSPSGDPLQLGLWCTNSSDGDPIVRFGGRNDAAAAANADFDWGIGLDRSSNIFGILYAAAGVSDASANQVLSANTSGHIGIGLIDQTSYLHVKNTSDFLSATAHVLHIEDSHSSATSDDVLARFDYSADADVDGARAISFHDSGGEIGSITLDGDATAFNTSSDYRLKTDLKDIVDATGIINKLKLYDFAWKKNTSKRLTGVIAHEAAEIVPYAIIGEKDAVITEEYTDVDGNVQTKESISAQAADYSKFVPLLLKAIQELSAKVDALEKAK